MTPEEYTIEQMTARAVALVMTKLPVQPGKEDAAQTVIRQYVKQEAVQLDDAVGIELAAKEIYRTNPLLFLSGTPGKRVEDMTAEERRDELRRRGII